MKKITLLLLFCFAILEIKAQTFNGPGTYKLKSYNSGNYPTCNTLPTNIIPSTTNGPNIALQSAETTTNNQVFTFVKNGETYTLGTVVYDVYNIKSEGSTTAGIVEFRSVTSPDSRATLRGNSAPVSIADNPRGVFIVVTDLATGAHRIRSAYFDGATNKYLVATLDNLWVNTGSFSAAMQDLWTFTPATVLSTSKFENSVADIKVYPNPTEGVFEIKNLPLSLETINLGLYSLDSKLLESKNYNVNNGTVKLDISGLAKGVYFVKGDSDSPLVAKVIKK